MNSVAVLKGLFVSTSLLGVFSLFLWWLLRKRRKEVRLPIVRILNLPQTKLPKVVVKRPPLVPFICFLIATFSFVVWSSAPKILEFANHEPKQLRVHVFVDMSPSVSAHVTLSKLAGSVSELWNDLHNVSRVTLSTSHGDTIYDVLEPSKVEEVILGLGYHRGGIAIGSAIKKHLIQTGEIDRLLVVTDRDQHSWSSFQWKYLSSDTEVFWVNLGKQDDFRPLTNVYVNAVSVVSAPGSPRIDWDVEVAQSGIAKAQEGSIRVKRGSQTLATSAWRFKEGSKIANIHISWPVEPLSNVRGASEEPLLWEITPQGEDAILMDNEFRTTEHGRGGLAKIVAEPSGELPLEDPASILQTVLRVIGIDTERVDYTAARTGVSLEGEGVQGDMRSGQNSQQALKEMAEADHWILLGGLSRGINAFCNAGHAKSIWIVPWSDEADFSELCQCVSLMVKSANGKCEDVSSRDSWIAWLNENGGKQVGGNIGDTKGAIAFSFSISMGGGGLKGPEILALTIPLKPSAKYGISYGRFPIVVRQLLNWKSGLNGEDLGVKNADWPRIEDLSKVSTPVNSIKVFADSSANFLTNVPLGESLLITENLGDLPPEWDSGRMSMASRGPSKMDSEDPLPWIKILLGLCFIAFVAEIIWSYRGLRPQAKWSKSAN